MTSLRMTLVVALWLPILLAADKPGSNAPVGDFASGAVSVLASKRCERLGTDKSVELPAVIYGPGKAKWGPKPIGPCRGLDTWVLTESIAAGALWTQSD